MRACRILAMVVICAIVPVYAAGFDFPPDATPSKSFEHWLAELLIEGRQRGYSEELLTKTLGGLQPLPQVLENDRAQPETKLTVDDYIRRRVTDATVRRGRKLLRTHDDTLAHVRDAFGIPPGIVVAIWGLESRFGDSRGGVPVFAALATLAWEGRRGAFFRSELYDALTIVDRGYIDAASMHGSWAGAMGQPQFMPSSYLAYAVDFDGDGRRDIWTSVDDTFASIANYLKRFGWQGDEWGREVRATAATRRRLAAASGARPSGCRAMREMTAARSLAEWRRLGLKRADGQELPSTQRQARLVLAGTRQFLVYENYDALLRYNCAHHYALSVALLADRLRN